MGYQCKLRGFEETMEDFEAMSEQETYRDDRRSGAHFRGSPRFCLMIEVMSSIF